MEHDELFDMGSHHKPRKKDKKKHHSRGFNEDAQETRKSRISFKKYMRSIREEQDSYDFNRLK